MPGVLPGRATGSVPGSTAQVTEPLRPGPGSDSDRDRASVSDRDSGSDFESRRVRLGWPGHAPSHYQPE